MRTVEMPRLFPPDAWVVLPCCLTQTVQNAPVRCLLAACALKAQRLQLFFQCLELFDAFDDMAHMGIEQAVDFSAVFCGRVLEVQQRAHFL